MRKTMLEQWKKVKNSGFTLIEMIAVVLIIGIVSAVTILSFSSVNRAKANSCAEKLAKLLDQTRNESMSRVEGSVSLVIRKEENAYYGILYINEGTQKSKVELGDGSLSIRFMKDGTADAVREIGVSGAEITICFRKGNGALVFDTILDGSAVCNPEFDSIQIVGTNTRVIELYRETGRNRLQ